MKQQKGQKSVFQTLLKLDVPHWYAVYTRPRAERRVAERLASQSIITYCPTFTSIRNWSDRRKKVVLPVFVSYVFVQVRKKDYQFVLRDPGVIQYVHHLGRPAQIQDREMECLKRFMGNLDEGTQPIVRLIRLGDLVTIQQGPLAGKEGIVKDKTRRKAFVVLDQLGMVVEIEERFVAATTTI